jgi:hypothetical protein
VHYYPAINMVAFQHDQEKERKKASHFRVGMRMRNNRWLRLRLTSGARGYAIRSHSGANRIAAGNQSRSQSHPSVTDSIAGEAGVGCKSLDSNCPFFSGYVAPGTKGGGDGTPRLMNRETKRKTLPSAVVSKLGLGQTGLTQPA